MCEYAYKNSESIHKNLSTLFVALEYYIYKCTFITNKQIETPSSTAEQHLATHLSLVTFLRDSEPPGNSEKP